MALKLKRDIMPSIDDLFPETDRTLYSRNPLIEVVCQVRFPTILKIEAHPPADLQEAVRSAFPLLERTTNPSTSQVPQELLKAIGAAQSGAGYIFRTADEAVSATLFSDSLTISTEHYERWEDFWGLASQCFTSLVQVYQPSFFNRLGLRYRNVVRRSSIDLNADRWSDLLNPYILGELAQGGWEQSAAEARRVIRCKSAVDGDSVLLQHGFVEIEGANEQCYLVDFDFYHDTRVEVGDIDPIFIRFNRRSGRAFRWTITERLHSALGPRAI